MEKTQTLNSRILCLLTYFDATPKSSGNIITGTGQRALFVVPDKSVIWLLTLALHIIIKKKDENGNYFIFFYLIFGHF
jgi:hypothetical protein